MSETLKFMQKQNIVMDNGIERGDKAQRKMLTAESRWEVDGYAFFQLYCMLKIFHNIREKTKTYFQREEIGF